MRLFTAIELDEVVREAAGARVAELEKRVRQGAPRARVTWVPPDRMHLTVRFIGEVNDALGERIISALREPLSTKPFTLAFDCLGAFPAKGPPRVFWLGVGSGQAAMVNVESLLGDRLIALGIPRDDRPYNPHLTLARIRDPAGLKTATLFDGLSPPRGVTRVDAITLFQSKLSPKGPTYVVLQRTPLRDG